jgi:hypothetical protein
VGPAATNIALLRSWDLAEYPVVAFVLDILADSQGPPIDRADSLSAPLIAADGHPQGQAGTVRRELSGSHGAIRLSAKNGHRRGPAHNAAELAP